MWSERWRSPSQWVHLLEDGLRAEGALVAHGGPFDRWDLDVRAGALSGVRVRTAVEEHVGGAQLLRVASMPRISIAAVAVVLSLAGLATAGLLDHGHLAGGILGAMAILLSAHLIRVTAAAAGAVARATAALAELAGR